MKRTLCLIFSLTLLCGSLLAGDFFIGDGTSTQNYVPVAGGSNYSWSKIIYTASEMQAAGFTATQNITRIAFQPGNAVSGYVMNNQQIYMRASYDAQYPSTGGANYPGTSGFTLVYNGSITWNGPGWVEIALDTPYSYNSSWGIELLWENHDGTLLAGYPKFRYTSDGSYTCVYKTGSTWLTTSGTRYRNRPNIWFMTPTSDPPSVAVPASPTDGATDIGITTSLLWNHTGGLPTGYRIWLGSNYPPSNIVAAQILTTNTYNPPEYLEYATTYYWRIVPFNDNGPATDCPIWSFTTMADPSITEFPHSQDFNADFPPTQWEHYSGSLSDPIHFGSAGSSQWQQDDWLNISTGDKAARINLWGTIQGFLVSPMFNVPSDDYILEFDMAFLKYGQPPTGTPPALTGEDDRFAILIGDGYTWNTSQIIREWNNTGSPYVLNEIAIDGERVSIPLSGHTGRIRIAFFAGSTLSNADNDFMIDNIRIGLPEAALGSPVPAITINPVTGFPLLSWDAITGANQYSIYASTDPYGVFTSFATTSGTSYEISSAESKLFFKIVAQQ